MVDWGTGRYETTAAELEPVAHAVVNRAAVKAGDDVADLACGTGNAALLAASCGPRVIGVDAARPPAPRGGWHTRPGPRGRPGSA